jgi:hypothetical protein
VTAQGTTCVGITRRCGPYCQSKRIHYLSYPAGRTSSVGAYGIVSRWMSKLRTRTEATNRIANEYSVDLAAIEYRGVQAQSGAPAEVRALRLRTAAGVEY